MMTSVVLLIFVVFWLSIAADGKDSTMWKQKRGASLSLGEFWKEKLLKRNDGTYLLTTYYVFPQNIIERNKVQDMCKAKFVPRDCTDIHQQWNSKGSGMYRIYPIGGKGHVVYCDMKTNGGGWTVIQKRFSGKLDFYRGWKEYKEGFGSVTGEHWIGNDVIHEISIHGQYELRVDLEDFDGNKRYAKYGIFVIQNEQNGYRLTIGSYSGNAGDSFTYANGMKFTTKDRDNDKHPGNCASSSIYDGAWWFNSCQRCHLNGRYYSSPSVLSWRGLMWQDWRGKNYSLKATQMMIRRH